MCCLLKTEERQWLPPTPPGAFVQAELCCHDLGTHILLGALLDVTSCSQSCFLELSVFPRGSSRKPVPGTYREKVKEWYKSHLEVPWQCSGCTSQLKRGFGVLMWKHKWRKGPQGLLNPWQHWSHRDGTEDDAVTVLLWLCCLGADQQRPRMCPKHKSWPVPSCVQGQQTTDWSNQGRGLRCRVPRDSRLFPLKRIKTSSNFCSFSCAALNRTISKRPAGCGLLTRLCMFCKITREQPGTVTSMHQKLLCKTPISCVLQRGLVFPHHPGSKALPFP